MKRLGILAALALELMVLGCGGPPPNQNVITTASGTWEGTLTGGLGDASALNFVTTFSVNGDGSLSITGFTFITNGPCFVAETASGSADLTTGSTTVVTGTVDLTVQSQSPTGNTLTLSGMENGTTITGTWTLSASTNCSGVGTAPGGNFTMTKTSSATRPHAPVGEEFQNQSLR
jgi:hypothetical protein